MSLFPGNVLVIDDLFNLAYESNEPEDASRKIQWENFKRLKLLLDNNSLCYSVITETKDIKDILSRMEKYRNIRLLILDLDLNDSGEVDDTDIAMIKKIVLESLDMFGYYYLAINSSYSEKWEDIKKELIEELRENEQENLRKIHFFSNFCITLDKKNVEIEDKILKLMSDKLSYELITQFEAGLNAARDKALSPFLDFTHNTWEYLYKILKEDMDSTEHINLTINNFMFGLLKQQMISTNYSVQEGPVLDADVDPNLHKSIIKSFTYLSNHNGQLNKHPVWTGNIYYNRKAEEPEKYLLIITPECDIAQTKNSGFTVISGFEFDFPADYNPDNYQGEIIPPLLVMRPGKGKNGKWKTRNEIEDYFFKGIGFSHLLHAGVNEKHLIFDLRSAYLIKNFPSEDWLLQSRVNDPAITAITDQFSWVFNRKGVPRIIPKKYAK